MTIHQSRIKRLEAKLAPKDDDLSHSPIIVTVHRFPSDDPETIEAKVHAAVGDNPHGRRVIAIILERDKPESPVDCKITDIQSAVRDPELRSRMGEIFDEAMDKHESQQTD